MQTEKPQLKKQFCNLSAETIALLADGQERLLTNRVRAGLPRDRRSVRNLYRIRATVGSAR